MAEFTNELKTNKWEVKTPNGWKDFKGIGKTVPYEEYEICTKSFSIICADDHLIKTQYGFKRSIDLNESDKIFTTKGFEQFISRTPRNKKSQMYDLLNVDGEEYFTNDILSHNSTAFQFFLTHYILFNEDKTVVILANKEKLAKELLSRIKTAYQQLPKWMQVGVVEWNDFTIELENGCRIMAFSTSSDAARGFAANIVVVDENAFISPKQWHEIFNSIYPALSSSAESKLILVSTANGYNHFYFLWEGANKGVNSFSPFEMVWYENENYSRKDRKFKYYTGNTIFDYKHEGEVRSIHMKDLYEKLVQEGNNDEQRLYTIKEEKTFKDFYGILKHKYREDAYDIIDYDWFLETLNNKGRPDFDQEYGNKFLTGSGTLISSEAIKTMKIKESLEIPKIEFLATQLADFSDTFKKGVGIFDLPEDGAEYYIGADLATVDDQSDGDNFALQVLKNNGNHLLQVARIGVNSGMHYTDIPVIVYIFHVFYNNAYIFMENNDQTAIYVMDVLRRVYDCENLYAETTKMDGFRTTTKTKRIGALNLKMVVEHGRLLLQDPRTITELSTFVKRKNSYEAAEGSTDDLVMSLIASIYFLNDMMMFGDEIDKLNIVTQVSDVSLKYQEEKVEIQKQIREAEEEPPRFFSGENYASIDEVFAQFDK